MRLWGNWLLIQRLVTTCLYKLLRLVFISIQRIYWQLNGTAAKLRDARLPHNYHRSAQVLDVVLFYKFCPGQITTVDNFLCTHSRFENPQYIIDNDNITLLTITENDAFFCETKEKGNSTCRFGACVRTILLIANISCITRKRGNCECIATQRPPDVAPDPIRFNYDAHAKFEVAQPIRCRLIAFYC